MQLALLTGALAVTIFVLIRSSYFVISSASAIARYLRVSNFLISFLLLSLATSLTELSVGVNSAVSGVSTLSLGDVLGTNLVNLTLILGLVAVIGGGIKLADYEQFKKTRLVTLLVVSTPFLLLLDGTLSRIDGIVLIILLILRLWLLINNNSESTTQSYKLSTEKHVYHTAENRKKFWTNIVVFSVSCAILVGSAYGVVHSVVQISELLGVSKFVIGLLVIAVGTSLPELTVGIRSIRSDNESMSLGNLFGAVTINSTLVLGVVSIISPISVPEIHQYAVTVGLTLLVIFLIYAILSGGRHILNRWQGVLLLVIYFVFLSLQLYYGVGF